MTAYETALVAMSGSTAPSILIKVSVTTAFALAASRLARRSAASHRHFVLAAAFGLLVLVPMASMLAPPLLVPVRVAVAPPAQLPIAATTVLPAAVVDAPVPADS